MSVRTFEVVASPFRPGRCEIRPGICEVRPGRCEVRPGSCEIGRREVRPGAKSGPGPRYLGPAAAKITI